MRYNCTLCNYSTTSKFNFNKHELTQKHVVKVQIIKKSTVNQIKAERIIAEKELAKRILAEKIATEKLAVEDVVVEKIATKDFALKNNQKICEYCKSVYSNQSSLARHLYTCVKKQEKKRIYDEEIKQLKHENKRLQEDLDCKRDMVQTLKETLEYERVREKGQLSASNYLTVTYNNVPALGFFNEYSIFDPLNILKITNSEFKQIETVPDDDIFTEDFDPTNLKNENQIELLDMLLTAQKNNQFSDLIGRCLVAYYKKKDPSEQQIWNSDDERLTYFIRKNLRWAIDKQGVKTGNLIIEPVLEYLTDIIRKFITSDPPSGKKSSCSEILRDNQRRAHALEILEEVKSGQTLQSILKYMAPHLYLDKHIKHLGKPKHLKTQKFVK